MLGLGGIGFVFHFKHDGDELQTRFIKVTEDEVALGARCGDFIVLAKFGSGEGIRTNLVKLCFRIDFQAFSDGLGGLLGLEILVKFHLFIGGLELDLIITADRRQGQLAFLFLKGQLVFDGVPLLFQTGQAALEFVLVVESGLFQLALEGLNFLLFFSQGTLHVQLVLRGCFFQLSLQVRNFLVLFIEIGLQLIF